jgi:hypothetical protein
VAEASVPQVDVVLDSSDVGDVWLGRADCEDGGSSSTREYFAEGEGNSKTDPNFGLFGEEGKEGKRGFGGWSS